MMLLLDGTCSNSNSDEIQKHWTFPPTTSCQVAAMEATRTTPPTTWHDLRSRRMEGYDTTQELLLDRLLLLMLLLLLDVVVMVVVVVSHVSWEQDDGPPPHQHHPSASSWSSWW